MEQGGFIRLVEAFHSDKTHSTTQFQHLWRKNADSNSKDKRLVCTWCHVNISCICIFVVVVVGCFFKHMETAVTVTGWWVYLWHWPLGPHSPHSRDSALIAQRTRSQCCAAPAPRHHLPPHHLYLLASLRLALHLLCVSLPSPPSPPLLSRPSNWDPAGHWPGLWCSLWTLVCWREKSENI